MQLQKMNQHLTEKLKFENHFKRTKNEKENIEEYQILW